MSPFLLLEENNRCPPAQGRRAASSSCCWPKAQNAGVSGAAPLGVFVVCRHSVLLGIVPVMETGLFVGRASSLVLRRSGEDAQPAKKHSPGGSQSWDGRRTVGFQPTRQEPRRSRSPKRICGTVRASLASHADLTRIPLAQVCIEGRSSSTAGPFQEREEGRTDPESAARPSGPLRVRTVGVLRIGATGARPGGERFAPIPCWRPKAINSPAGPSLSRRDAARPGASIELLDTRTSPVWLGVFDPPEELGVCRLGVRRKKLDLRSGRGYHSR
jgi:hypothetical protein